MKSLPSFDVSFFQSLFKVAVKYYSTLIETSKNVLTEIPPESCSSHSVHTVWKFVGSCSETAWQYKGGEVLLKQAHLLQSRIDLSLLSAHDVSAS